MMNHPDRCPLDDSFVERTVLLRRLETLICLIVILLALALAIHHYDKLYKRVKIMATTGPLQEARTADLYYWNLHGAWPQTTRDALDFIGSAGFCDKRFNTLIEDGVIQIEGREGSLAGEVVSIHPVTPRTDPLGPVHWRFGPDQQDPRLLVQGADRTTLPRDRFLSDLR